jgi:polyhydroxyalkanoate synthase
MSDSRLQKLWARLARPRDHVGLTPADTVHAENKWRLLRYRARREGIAHPTPIVMLPSLINRHYVLDLMSGKSLVEYLVGRGHDVFMVDWGVPGDEDRYLEFDDIVDRYVGRAIRRAARVSASHGVHLFGYCMGGTLAAIHAAVRPERVESLLTLAAPIDFHDTSLLSRWTRTQSFEPAAIIEACGNVPWPLMQASFHLLRPTLLLSKAVGVADRIDDDEFLDGFFALETWGNDNVSFPGAAYRTWVEELYQRNALVAGTLTLSGEPVKLERISCPTLVVTFEHDHIVSAASAAALVDRVQRGARLHLPGGHVGAVVSRKASKELWPALARFWEGEATQSLAAQ